MKYGPIWAPMLILLADTLPGAVRQDSSKTRYSLSFGTGAARYEDKSFDCNGDLISADPVDLTSTGARADVWTGALRVSLFAGSTAYQLGWPDFAGTYGGGLVAGEWSGGGFGLGLVHVPGEEVPVYPALYVRGGALDKAHLRIDFLPPTESWGATGWLRLGVGKGELPGTGLAWLFGINAMPYSYPDKFEPRAFGELDIPLGRRIPIYVLLQGQVGPGAERTQTSWSVGLRYWLAGAD
jgi:hypothetical protein